MNDYAKSALLGAAGGLRASAAPFAAAWAESGAFPVRPAVALGGEIVADKLPFVGSRTRLGPLIGRASAAAFAARRSVRSANAGTIAVAALASVAVAFAASRLRMAAAERFNVPQQVVGIAEDALVLALAYVLSSERE